MGRKCSTVYDNISCRSGYPNDTSGIRVLAFPTDIEERKRWLSKLPNFIKLEVVTKNMGVCLKHWKVGFEYRIGPGGYPRPLHPPTEFGSTPTSFSPQTTTRDRRSEERGVTSEKRSMVIAEATRNKDNNIIGSWEDLCTFCKEIPLATQITDEEVKLLKLSDDPFLIEFLISITKDFKVKAYRGSTLVNVRDLIDSFHCKLILYTQITEIIDRLSEYTPDLQNDIGHVGEHFYKLVDQSGLEEEKKKKVRFLCNQMILHGKKIGGARYDTCNIRDALEIFLRNRNAYKALRNYLVLPCDKTLKSYFGKLGSAGSSEECQTVIKNVFSGLEETEKFCYITADEIYVKSAVRYRAGHVIGLGVDQDPPKPAKTVLAFMVNFLYGTPAFIARLLPVTSLKSEFLMEQLMLLIKIIHDAGGFVFLVMTDNLSVNQKLFKLLQQKYHKESLSAICHPISNIYFKYMNLCYDPPHMLKNIRNNWTTEKTQTLEFKDPDSEKVVRAKWSDLKIIYKEESESSVKCTKLDYATMYPNNYEKQKVSLALNIFNEKTVAALKLKHLDETALFVEKVLKMWNIINVKGPDEGRNLNNPDKYPVNRPDDERLDFLLRMATSLKLMDTSKKGKRVRGLTGDTSNAWHRTLNGLVDMLKSLLKLGVKYICIGKIQSDHLEGEFGVIRQLSGGNYWISVEQVICSLSLRRMKLYHSLELENVDSVGEIECCKGSLADRDDDLELLDSCFDEASDLTETERASLYYISGYVAFKEDLRSTEHGANLLKESEFTEMVSRGKLKHPPPELYDLSLYMYTFFKNRKTKCCSKIFLEAYMHIYSCIGYKFENIDKIIRRFSNCFFKGYAKNESDKIKCNKAAENTRKRRKLNS